MRQATTRRRARHSPTTTRSAHGSHSETFITARPVHRETLANGLRVVVAPLPHLHQALVGLWVRAGARYDACGVSHFLEHAMHAGTRRYPNEHALALAIDRIGGQLDATTSEDDSVFPLTVPSSALGEASALVAEMVQRPTLRSASAERKLKNRSRSETFCRVGVNVTGRNRRESGS